MNIFSILFFIFVAQNHFLKIETVGTPKCIYSNDLSTCIKYKPSDSVFTKCIHSNYLGTCETTNDYDETNEVICHF
jgi:hypothetical protein